MIDVKKVLDSLFIHIDFVINNEQGLLKIGSIEKFYNSLCELYRDIPSIYNQLLRFENYIKGIESKNQEEKRQTLLKLYSLYRGPFFDFSENDLNNMVEFFSKDISDQRWLGERAIKKLIEKGLFKYKDILFYLPYRYIEI
jgi:hypothetical protein